MNSSSEPLVSVVMPVRDGMPYVEAAIRSICEQTLADLELIVVDDGSTDATPDVLRTLSKSDERIRCFRQENRGVIASLNRGFELAGGRYVARMDADDVALPHRLERQVDYLERHPDTVMIGSAIELVDPAGRQFKRVIYPSDDTVIRETLERENCFAHPTVVIRSDVLRELGGFRPGFLHAEDYELWTRVAERYRVANLAEPLLLYRVHSGNVTHRRLREQVHSILAIQAASRIRRTTGMDPVGWDELISPELLGRLGVEPEAVERLYYDACLGWAKYTAAAGGRQEALELLDQATELARRRPDRRAAVAFALFTRARVLSELGLRPQAAFVYCRALATDPNRTRFLLARNLRRLVSSARRRLTRVVRR